MRELIVELLLRLPKVIVATLVAAVAWLLATGPGNAAPTPELWILCFIGGGILVLLVQEGPL